MIRSCLYTIVLLLFSSCLSLKTNSLSTSNILGNQDVVPSQAKPQEPLQDVTQYTFPYLSAFNNNRLNFSANQIRELENILELNIEPEDDLNLLFEAASWIGTPYKHAGNTRDGVDCSGLTAAIYKNVYSTILDRRSDGQFTFNCYKISTNELKSGDLVFFKINSNKISHVGIYLKNNKFLHASLYRGVVVNDLTESYYKKYFYSAGRVK